MEAVDQAETPEAKAAAEKEYQKQADLLNKRGQAYKDFCKDNNLKQRNERITIAKWDREQAKAARVAAKNKINREAELRSENTYTQDRFSKTVEKAKKHGIIKVKNSDLENGLPIEGNPNTIVDKTDDAGITLQRRLYGADGKASVDFDTSDHGLPKAHPTGAHKHVFDYKKKKPRGKPQSPTEQELTENKDIIQKGVNYHDEE